MYDWKTIGQDLKRHPNKWAKVYDRDRLSLAQAIRLGVDGLRPFVRQGQAGPGYQVRTRNKYKGEDGTTYVTLYLRFVPEERGER